MPMNITTRGGCGTWEPVKLGGMSEPASYSHIPPSTHPSHMARCGWFWAWAAVGATGALGMISLGPIALIPAAAAAAALAASRNGRQSVFGLLAGAGLLSLFVAYLQREGPGTTCWHTATAS